MRRSFAVLHRGQRTPGNVPFATTPRADAKPGPSRNGDHATSTDSEVRKLVQRVFILPETVRAPEAVAFCGADSGAGCSWVCVCAAEVLAEQVTGTICVVDVNLRSPSLHEYLHTERAPGFAEILENSRPVREFARRERGNNLWLITAGAPGKSPEAALHPARLRARFSELRAEFDWVLVDTPPVCSYADAVLLGQLTDGIVLIVGSNSTRRESARIAKESFEAARIPMLGAVLNKRTYPIPEALYQKL